MEDFEDLYNKYWKLVFNAAYKRLGDLEIAKDITQDVFVQLLTRQEREPVANIPAYLLISVRNAVFKHLEKSGRIAFTDDSADDVTDIRADADAGIRNREFQVSFQKMVDALPAQQRIIFKLRFDEDLSSAQIAEKLDISPKTVRNQMGKALSTLRSSLFLLIVGLILSII